MSIKVRIISVTTEYGENDTDVEYRYFKSYDDLWNYIDKEFDEEDVNGERVRDQYGSKDIVYNENDWYVRFQVL